MISMDLCMLLAFEVTQEGLSPPGLGAEQAALAAIVAPPMAPSLSSAGPTTSEADLDDFRRLQLYTRRSIRPTA